jgi:glycosyltransferase involved in cell wall biosynthesis
MNILFIHQNFPGQFKALAPALAADPKNKVVALTMQPVKPGVWMGVQVLGYQAKRSSSEKIHPWVADVEAKAIRAEACFYAAQQLKASGFTPDIVIAHPGWGESLFIKDVWPNTRLGIFCEFFYQAHGADVGFDPEFQVADIADPCRLRLKNVNNYLQFETADLGISPTKWQASTFPKAFQKKITIVHDGIDTDLLVPNAKAHINMKTNAGQDHRLTAEDEVVTFVNRNLEPYRGFHTFMRALPAMLKARPNARFIMVGGDNVSYGSKPTNAASWKEVMIKEVRPQISDSDWQRVHFVGKVAYPHFVNLLQISSVHVYLTYPFVLSWSLLEAMSVQCAIVASRTPPVEEVISHGKTGHLVDFFDHQALANEVCGLLADPAKRAKLGAAARKYAVSHYDLKTKCLPRQMAWVQELAALPGNQIE